MENMLCKWRSSLRESWGDDASLSKLAAYGDPKLPDFPYWEEHRAINLVVSSHVSTALVSREQRDYL